MRLVAFIATLLLAAVVAAPASAQTTTDVVGEAAQALQSDPVFVHPDAEASVDENAIRERVERGDAGDVFVAVLPESAGAPGPAAQALFNEMRRSGTYAVISGRSFAAGNPNVSVRALATQAVQAKRGEGGTAIVLDFVDRVAELRAQSGGGEGGGVAAPGSRTTDPAGDGASGGTLLAILGLLGLGGLAAAVISRRRRRREERAQLDEVKTIARDDLVALGDDIRALDLDVEMPDVDPEGKRYYGQAVEAYSRAENQFNLARHPDDLEPVSRDLEEGRYAMTAAKERLAGRAVPERRPPCFFDPRHGPSVEDVEWAPPGGQPRPVPACAADATRIRDGYDPETREIDVDGYGRMPYYAAPGYYGGYTGGFFGGFPGMGFGGFFPGLFLGSMLGGGLGGHDTYIENNYGDGGDFGGGDFGGGDFGGGDFGGGDFGGGDF